MVRFTILTLVLHGILQNTASGFHVPSAITKPKVPSFGKDYVHNIQRPTQILSSNQRTLRSPTSLNVLPASLAMNVVRTMKGGASVLQPLFSDNFYVLSAVMVLSTLGLTLERRTKIGKALSAPLATMGMGLIIANLGIMPFGSPVYDFVNKYLVAFAVPLLLFDSDLRRVVSDTGTLLIAFLVGAVSTIIGTLITYPLLPLKSMGSEGWKIASALAARHIGGAINFVAVSETLNVSGSSISAAIAADNVVIALYFGMLFSLAKAADESDSDNEKLEIDVRDPEDVNAVGSDMTMPSIATSITVASCLVIAGKLLTTALLPTMSALPLISLTTVAAATICPRFFKELSFTGTCLGVIFMQMFFAVSGAAGSIKLVMEKAPALFLFSAMQVAIHFVSLMFFGRLILKLDPNELYLASNANVGGPTTAAAMATGKGWKKLVLPSLLVGILGYATATPIALLLGKVLTKLPLR